MRIMLDGGGSGYKEVQESLLRCEQRMLRHEINVVDDGSKSSLPTPASRTLNMTVKTFQTCGHMGSPRILFHRRNSIKSSIKFSLNDSFIIQAQLESPLIHHTHSDSLSHLQFPGLSLQQYMGILIEGKTRYMCNDRMIKLHRPLKTVVVLPYHDV